MEFKYQELTHKIIGCAMEVHKLLGPGLLESAYEECLVYELVNAGLYIERQKAVPVIYKEIKLECGYRIDILVENTVVIELKTVEAFNQVHEAQVLTYMKFAVKPVGLLINFSCNAIEKRNKEICDVRKLLHREKDLRVRKKLHRGRQE